MDTRLLTLFAAILLLLGILFRQERAKSWLFGKDGKNSGGYNMETSMKFFSNLMIALAACNLLSVVGGKLNNVVLVMAGVVLGSLLLLAALVYFMKSKKFRA